MSIGLKKHYIRNKRAHINKGIINVKQILIVITFITKQAQSAALSINTAFKYAILRKNHTDYHHGANL